MTGRPAWGGVEGGKRRERVFAASAIWVPACMMHTVLFQVHDTHHNLPTLMLLSTEADIHQPQESDECAIAKALDATSDSQRCCAMMSAGPDAFPAAFESF